MNGNLKLPVGIDDFRKIRECGFYYVDKTKLVEQLMQNWGEVNLFTRPRRFGKTLNMSMLRSFFEIGTDKSLFDGLYISRNKELCDMHMGKYPVISITLKGIEGMTFEEARNMLKIILKNEARRHYYLKNSDRLTDDDKQQYEQILLGTSENTADSLRLLSQLLFLHYDKKVVILIDEYDVPLDRSPLMLIFSFTMAFIMGGKMALIFLVVIPILGIGLFAVIHKVGPLFKRVFRKYDALNNSIQENVKGMRVVKSFVREAYEKEKFHHAAEEVCQDFTRAEKILAINSPLMQFCLYVVMIFVLETSKAEASRSAITSASLVSSHPPCIRLRARFSAFSCSGPKFTTTQSISVSPISSKTFNRWWPPTTLPVASFQTTGSTNPNSSMERFSFS